MYAEKTDYDDIEMSLYQVRVIAVNDNYDSDNYDGSIGGMKVAFKNLIYMLYSRNLSNKIRSAKRTRTGRINYIPFRKSTKVVENY